MVSILFKILIVTLAAKQSVCTIAGLSYMDPLNFRPLPDKYNQMDPCNPLYWYPKQIPEYCYMRTATTPKMAEPPADVVPLPIPVPMPPPPPYPPPFLPMPPMPLPALPLPRAVPMAPMIPLIPPQVPFGVPLRPSNPMLPVPGLPYPPQFYNNPYQQQAGMVPGIHGLVSDDGGINILPFSDAYSDMLEKHKNKMLRKKMHKLFRDYEVYPRRRRHNRKRIHYVPQNGPCYSVLCYVLI